MVLFGQLLETFGPFFTLVTLPRAIFVVIGDNSGKKSHKTLSVNLISNFLLQFSSSAFDADDDDVDILTLELQKYFDPPKVIIQCQRLRQESML